MGTTREIKEWLADYERAELSKVYKQLYGVNDMKLNEVYTSSSSFLKASDLQGRTIRVKISGVGVHEFEDKKKQIVLSFEGKEKKLGLNVTNANSIAKILGEDTDSWVGGEIKIYPTVTDFGDKKDVPCIRVIEELPPEDVNSEIPF